MYVNPYDYAEGKPGKWLRCNFHAHAGTGPGTCGSLGLYDVIDSYSASDYDVLMISNHDIYTDTSRCANIGVIQGVEYSTHPHMLTVGVREALAGTHQEVIDKAREMGGFVILCHPNWMRKNYLDEKSQEKFYGYRGIEILNPVIYRLSGSGFACDVWDSLLSRGKLAYGFGNDDFHIWFDLGKSWNRIFSKSADYGDIKDSVDAGCFYVSTGLDLDYLSLENDSIRVKAKYMRETYVDEFDYAFIGANGKLLKRSRGKDAFYTISGNEMYVRVEVTSEEGFKLFSQPIYKQGLFSEP